MKRFSSIVTALVLLTSIALPSSTAARPATDDGDFDTTITSKVKTTGLYIVELADPPVVSYRGGVTSLGATSPAALGTRKVNNASSATQSYRAYLSAKRTTALRGISKIVGGTPDVRQTYDTAFNGFAVKLTPAQAKQVERLSGISHVYVDKINSLQTDYGPSFIGAMQKGDVAKPALFRATVNGANEKPAPVTSNASGAAVFNYNDATNTLTLQIKLAGITPIGQHIHRVANPDGTGPVAYDLTPYKVADAPNPVYVGAVTLTAPDEANLYAGKLYVNFHTTANPAGEIRGDIVADKGEGMLVGIIDTGINFSHKSFASPGEDGYTYTNPLGAGKYVGVCNPADPSYTPTFVCNSKLIGAWTFDLTKTSPGEDGVPSPSDDNGHGSHTGSTTAGNVVSASINGINIGTVSGVAPHANVIAYDVCGYIVDGNYGAGCPNSASVAAVDQAVKDGVDVVNYSIGGDSGDPWFDPTARAFLNALDSGVLASVSAGNSGPGAETIGSPSNAPWVMSVAASTHNRTYNNVLVAGGVSYNGKGFSVPLTTAAQLVLAKDYQDEDGKPNNLCYPFKAGTSLAGKIVICDRGVIGRVEKAENAQKAGAAGFVLTNTSATLGLNGDIYPIPAVHLLKSSGDALKAAVAANPNLSGTIQGATKDTSDANGDILTSFSSRGPDATSASVLKPDVAAPGLDIIAALGNTNPAIDEFGTESGTSMAAPHNAGAATLLRSLHPDWSVAETRSALMLTAVTALRNEGPLDPATPFGIGAGRIDVGKAALSGLVLDESADGFFTSYEALGGDPRNVNIASLADPACVVTCTWTRTFSNTLDSAVTWNVTTAITTAATLTVVPTNFTVARGGTQTITITADLTNAPLDEYTFGQITLTPAAPFASVPVAHLPVAAQPVAARLPGVITGEANTKTGTVTVDNLTAVAISNLKINTYGLVSGHQDDLRVATDSDNSGYLDNLNDGVAIRSFTVPTDTVRFVTEVITTTAVDVDMYVFLDGSGAKAADGVPQADELACTSATGSALERCDITAPDAGTYLVLVNNYEGAGLPKDLIKLSTAVVPPVAKGNLTVTGPTSVPAKQAFSLNLAYNITTLQPGSRWYGAITLATQPTGGVDLGYIPVDLVNTKYGQFLTSINRK